MNSCTKELETVQHGVLSTDAYYANASDDQAIQLVANVYRTVYTSSFWNSLFNGLSDDGLATGEIYSNINITSASHDGKTYFTALYRINYLCNMIIEKLPASSNVKKQVIGEAYFWRAWANFYLIRFWGTPPLVDHVLAQSELTPANGSSDALWSFFESSLDQAINLLPEKSSIGGQKAIGGRVTKHSAYALLGKGKLIRGDYAGAINALEKIIGSGKYALNSDFTKLYHMAADFSDEYMWEFEISDNNASNFTLEMDYRSINLTWSSGNVVVPGGNTQQGWGGADFGKGFYDFMIGRGEKGKPRYMGTIWDYEDIQNRFISLGLASNKDEAITKFWLTKPMINCQGYFRSKMLPWDSELYKGSTSIQVFSKANWPGMRYAEVLLMYAEACVQSNSKISEGLSAVNKIRERAGLSGLSSYTLQDLKDEKRAEMAYENERYFDLIRWGDAPTKLANRGSATYSFYGYVNGTTNYDVTSATVVGATGFKTGRDELFPFPYDELLLNSNLKQNNSW